MLPKEDGATMPSPSPRLEKAGDAETLPIEDSVRDPGSIGLEDYHSVSGADPGATRPELLIWVISSNGRRGSSSRA